MQASADREGKRGEAVGIVYINNVYVMWASDTAITSGQPGVGVIGVTGGNGIARVDLGPLDAVAPNAVNAQTVATSVFPNRVDFQWQGVLDDSIGTGVAFYQIWRDNTFIGEATTPSITDSTVAAGHSAYSYRINTVDYHWNIASVTIPVTTPPAGAIDPRRVGARPLGTYWGAGGEQIDMRSGDLNYSVPLVKAMGRGGWGVSFNLTYNCRTGGKTLPSGNWARTWVTATAGNSWPAP